MDKVYLIKTFDDGNVQWEKTYGGTENDSAYCIEKAADGGYIISGSTASSGNGGSDVLLLKIDQNGDELWSQTYGGAAAPWRPWTTIHSLHPSRFEIEREEFSRKGGSKMHPPVHPPGGKMQDARPVHPSPRAHSPTDLGRVGGLVSCALYLVSGLVGGSVQLDDRVADADGHLDAKPAVTRPGCGFADETATLDLLTPNMETGATDTACGFC